MSKLIWWLGLAGGSAALVLGASRANIPDQTFWSTRQSWILAALGATFLLPLMQAAVVERGERRRRKAVERERKVQAFLSASLIYVVEQGGAPWKTTGIQVFIVRGAWWWKRQDRIAKMRIGAIPTSGVKWSKGKGVIGRCWASRQAQYVDLDAHFSRFADSTREAWNALTDDERFGLTYEDFVVLRGKYGIVAAVPIVKEDKYVGCITADMPPLGADVAQPNRQQILESLASTAALVAYVLKD